MKMLVLLKKNINIFHLVKLNHHTQMKSQNRTQEVRFERKQTHCNKKVTNET